MSQGSTVIPSLRYRDAHAAIDWLCNVFGFTKQLVYENPEGGVAHAQLTRGDGMVMLGSATNDGHFSRHSISPEESGGRVSMGLSLIADDCTAIYARAKAAGAEIIHDLSSPEYGGHAFTCRDPGGYIWWVGSFNPWTA